MFHDLRTHPIRRANLWFMPRISIHTLCRYSKICQLGYPFFIKQNIRSFDIPVYLFIRMQIHQPMNDRFQYRSNFVLSQFLLGDVEQIYDGTCVAILQDYP